MCGGCGGVGPDWSLPYVSGSRRRAAIAALLGGLSRRITVGTMRQGWTVRTATGGWSVARTLDELVDATAQRVSFSSWAEVQEAVRVHSRDRCDPVPARQPTRPGVGTCALDTGTIGSAKLAALDAIAVPVLSEGELHLRLAAFALGVRVLPAQPVALELAPGMRLLATEGRLSGALARGYGQVDGAAHRARPELTGASGR